MCKCKGLLKCLLNVKIWHDFFKRLFLIITICIKSPCTASTALLALIEVHGLLIQTLPNFGLQKKVRRNFRTSRCIMNHFPRPRDHPRTKNVETQSTCNVTLHRRAACLSLTGSLTRARPRGPTPTTAAAANLTPPLSHFPPPETLSASSH